MMQIMKIMKVEGSNHPCLGMTFFLQMITSCCSTFISHRYFKVLEQTIICTHKYRYRRKEIISRKQILLPFIVHNMSKFGNRPIFIVSGFCSLLQISMKIQRAHSELLNLNMRFEIHV